MIESKKLTSAKTAESSEMPTIKKKQATKKSTAKKAGWQKFKIDDVIQALIENKGVKTATARALNCDRQTILNYCKKFPEVNAASVEARASLVDLAEEGLIEQLEAGYFPAIKYTLSTLGKDRGYIERSEIDTKGTLDLTSEPERTHDFSKLTLEEQNILADLMIKAEFEPTEETQ